ncbi:MAG TPA: NADH:flavin oxidoreductase/NADH oxidase family protein [Oscillatoriaceae cyanobacterium]
MTNESTTQIDAPRLLAQSLELPCGAVLSNRLAKAAMAEAMGTASGAPTAELERLYRRWAAGGSGLLITGNVMIDPAAMGEPNDVVVEDDRHLEALARWARAARSDRTAAWVQINHPGRQSMSPDPVAPSAVPLAMGHGVFKKPRALTEAEIKGIIARFARTAAVVQQAGFDGVQIHGAHGYLISQFLSPRTNQRDDAWGGSLDNRMRFLLEIVAAIREAVGAGFPIGVKLNSADFQRGGFTEDESLAVVRALEAAGIDLLEISGGTYEAAAMMGSVKTQKESTRQREAYFLDYARKVRQEVKLPLMLTGGFRTAEGMASALAEGAIDVVGLARPLALEPDLPARLLSGEARRSEMRAPKAIGHRMLDDLVGLAWYQQQLQRMGRGLEPDPERSSWLVLACQLLVMGPSLLARTRSR